MVRDGVDLGATHKTSGDLIFSARRWRLTLFHAWGRAMVSGGTLMSRYEAHGRDGGEDAGLVSELVVGLAVIPA